MSYIIQDNSVWQDLYVVRTARLQFLKAFIEIHAPALALPPELFDWARNAYDIWYSALIKSDAEWAEKEGAFLAIRLAEEPARARLTIIKELLNSRYVDRPELLERYNIDSASPRSRVGMMQMADDVYEMHARLKAEGDPLVLPDAMISGLRALMDAVRAAEVKAQDEFEDAKSATKELRAIFEADSKMLALLYDWAVAMWGAEDPRMLEIGFVQRLPESGGGGGNMPSVPEGFELKWLEPFLKFWWNPVEGATSYQLAFSADNGASWEELYSGAEVGFEFEPPAGKRLYRVRARNANGFGDWSATLEHEVEGEPPASEWPNAPEVVGAELITDPGFFMRVFYSIPGGSDTISLYRAVVPTGSPAPERPAVVFQTDITAPQFADTDIEAGNDYYYWACGVKGGEEGDFAGPAFATVVE